MCSEIWLQESELAVCGSSLKSLWSFQTGGKNAKRVPCKLCDQQLANGGGTTNLLSHLQLKHPEEYKRCTNHDS